MIELWGKEKEGKRMEGVHSSLEEMDAHPTRGVFVFPSERKDVERGREEDVERTKLRHCEEQ